MQQVLLPTLNKLLSFALDCHCLFVTPVAEVLRVQWRLSQSLLTVPIHQCLDVCNDRSATETRGTHGLMLIMWITAEYQTSFQNRQ
jgi:hypothetical protein